MRGEAENAILTTLRRLSYWERADIERDPEQANKCVAVTLVADRSHESTVREIMKRSFDLTFPDQGGNGEVRARAATNSSRSRRTAARE